MNDDQLIESCRKGERRAMEELYNRFAPKMRGLCFRYVRSVFEVDDVLQEAFIKVFSKLSSFKGNGSLEGWIRRIVVNTAINYYHSNLNQSANVMLEAVKEVDLDPVEITDRLSIEELYTVISKLPDGYRFVFNMFAIDGFSHKEIADSLNITESTSRSQYTRARKHLISLLEQHNITDNA